MAATMVNSPGMTEEQSSTIQEWVGARIEEQLADRLTMASLAIDFVNNFDKEEQELVDKVEVEADRVGQAKADLDTPLEMRSATEREIEGIIAGGGVVGAEVFISLAEVARLAFQWLDTHTTPAPSC